MCPKTPAIWNNNDLPSLSLCLSLWILDSSALSFTWELCFLSPENPELTFTWKTLAKKSYSFWIGKITMLMSSLRCFLQSCWLITFPVLYIFKISHGYNTMWFYVCIFACCYLASGLYTRLKIQAAILFVLTWISIYHHALRQDEVIKSIEFLLTIYACEFHSYENFI